MGVLDLGQSFLNHVQFPPQRKMNDLMTLHYAFLSIAMPRDFPCAALALASLPTLPMLQLKPRPHRLAACARRHAACKYIWSLRL